MSIINNNLLLAAEEGGYRIERSLRFRSAASAYLDRTFSSAGNRKTMTFSMWMKRGVINTSAFSVFYQSGPSGAVAVLLFQADNRLSVSWDTALNGLTTTPVYRDPSSWYHIVVAIDTPQATASNRIKVYVNGVQVTSFSAANYPTQNVDTLFNTTELQHLGSRASGTSGFDGYLTEINFVDGQALTPSDFGEFNEDTGVWQPKRYAGTYGTNGFYLNFKDNASTSALGTDYSGNGNTWTTNNISLTAGATYDSMIDVPTPYADGGNGRGNYCVINPIGNNIAFSVTNGNLTISNSTGAQGTKPASFFCTSGKWYWEVTGNAYAGAVCGTNGASFTGSISSTGSNGIGYWEGGLVYWDGGNSGAGPASYNTSDIIGVALNMDAGTVAFYKNNSLQFTATFGSGTVPNLSTGCFPCYNEGNSGPSKTANFNFGQRPFAYTPPTGFKALNTQNLPEPVIAKGGEHMAATLYAGSASQLSVTGVGFSPDLVWIKTRNASTFHELYDSIRGRYIRLSSNSTEADNNLGATGGLLSFDSDGFTVPSTANFGNNGAGYNYVSWNWRGSDSAAVTNTAGSITSTVSANPTAGFSIVRWTTVSPIGTVGHGLGVTPSIVLFKRTDTSQEWYFETNIIDGSYDYLVLNSTAAKVDGGPDWSTRATSTTITSFTATAGATYVAYCFAEVAGYSRFGRYTGNGSADGPFVFCGFRPRWILVKRTDAVSSWIILDTARNTANVMDSVLWSNLSSAEGTFTIMDALSNGFKLRENSNGYNVNNGTYIFAAFAESPFKYSLAR